MSRVRDVVDVLRGRRHVFHGWWLLGASVFAMALAGGLSFWSFGLYVNPLEEEFGWSRAQVALGFSFSLLAGGVVAPYVGNWIDHRGARSAIVLGGATTGLTYVLLAATDTLWQWYLLNGLNAAFRQFMFIIPFQTLISRWFDRKRGLALSFLGVGFSLGGLIVLPLITLVIDIAGWRGGFIVTGIVLSGAFVPIGLLVVRNHPADVGQHPDGEAPRDQTAATGTNLGLTLAETLRQPLFWVIAAALTLFLYGLVGWQVHQVPFYESKGFSRGTAALIVSAGAGFAIFARLLMGVVADRFARFELVIMFLSSVLVCGASILLVSSSPAAIAAFVLLWLIGTSAGPMIEALVLTRAFGVTHFASIFGVIIVVEMLGQIVSPAVAGYIFDETGSYDGALIMWICTFLGCLVLFGVATRMKQPVKDLPAPVEAPAVASSVPPG